MEEKKGTDLMQGLLIQVEEATFDDNDRDRNPWRMFSSPESLSKS